MTTKHAAEDCPDKALHAADQPRGYLAWHEWAEEKAKTHRRRLAAMGEEPLMPMTVRCPGGHNWTCEEEVEATPHWTDASVLRLAEHDCPRRYVNAEACMIREDNR